MDSWYGRSLGSRLDGAKPDREGFSSKKNDEVLQVPPAPREGQRDFNF